MKALPKQSAAGFTVIELLAALGILAIATSMAAPNFWEMVNHMRAGQDIREFADVVRTARGEAIRLRTPVRLEFTALGYTVDIGDDGSIDTTHSLGSTTHWFGGTIPDDITFNGLGVLVNVAGPQTVSVTTETATLSVSVNLNGYVEIG